MLCDLASVVGFEPTFPGFTPGVLPARRYRTILLADLPGFEPGIRGSKPRVLPLHHRPIEVYAQAT